jgi:hypothetical protein
LAAIVVSTLVTLQRKAKQNKSNASDNNACWDKDQASTYGNGSEPADL